MDWTTAIQTLKDLFNENIQIQVIAEVALAILLGGIIGFERETADKPAGFRTHMLVAGAAALLVGLGSALLYSFSADLSKDFIGKGGIDTAIINTDPLRIIQAIITGISFLGAGTVVYSRQGHVEGLTTAASLLFSAAVGIAVALRQHIIAIGVTLLAVVILRGIKFIEKRLIARRIQERDKDDEISPD